jgi:hypothetical protein
MNPAFTFRIDLIKLTDGFRVLRVTDAATATTLERRLDPNQPVARQKDAICRALQLVLDQGFNSTVAA